MRFEAAILSQQRLLHGLLLVSLLGCNETASCPADPGGRCGNGVIDEGELCDEGLAPQGAWRDGVTCASVTGEPAAVGRLRCHCCTPYTEQCILPNRRSTSDLWDSGLP